jgi:UDP-glucose 4-epimerase
MVEIAGQRFLIIGGASLSGSHIADKLVLGGAAHVVLFDNFSLASRHAIAHFESDDRVSVFLGDMLRLETLIEAMQGIDGVFLVAAFLAGPLAADLRQGLDVNIHGVRNVLEACRLCGVKRIVFSSSVGMYGNAGHLDSIDESTPLMTDGMGSIMAIYSASKLIGESLCRLYFERYGLEWAALRYSSIYGPRQHSHSINALPIIEIYEDLVAGKRPIIYGDGEDVHDYVYVGDLAMANVKAMRASGCGAASVVSGESRSINEIAHIIGNALQSELRPEYRNPENRLAFTKSKRLRYSRAKAKELWSWEPEVRLEEGISRYVEWRQGKRVYG